MSKNNCQVIFCTCPNIEVARELARGLVAGGAAACVNIIAGVESIYRWRGKTEQGTESLLVIKTAAARYAEVEAYIQQHHPYELPEVIAVPIEAGAAGYLSWLIHPENN